MVFIPGTYIETVPQQFVSLPNGYFYSYYATTQQVVILEQVSTVILLELEQAEQVSYFACSRTLLLLI